MRFMLSAFAISSLCTPLHAQAPEEAPFWRPVVMGTFGMVAAEHPRESMAGWQVLEAGGNAFDAAAAVFYMTTVVEQHQAGMGAVSYTHLTLPTILLV